MLSVSFGNVETLALELGSLASLFGSVALPRRREAFEAWQGALAAWGSLALPKRREACEAWHGAFRQFGTLALYLVAWLALPRRREAFEAWQVAFRQFRKRRKEECLGSLG